MQSASHLELVAFRIAVSAYHGVPVGKPNTLMDEVEPEAVESRVMEEKTGIDPRILLMLERSAGQIQKSGISLT